MGLALTLIALETDAMILDYHVDRLGNVEIFSVADRSVDAYFQGGAADEILAELDETDADQQQAVLSRYAL